MPDQYQYLTEALELNSYPTHFVINKGGLITKKVNDFRCKQYALKNEIDIQTIHSLAHESVED